VRLLTIDLTCGEKGGAGGGGVEEEDRKNKKEVASLSPVYPRGGVEGLKG
jgi:hypothetical protein